MFSGEKVYYTVCMLSARQLVVQVVLNNIVIDIASTILCLGDPYRCSTSSSLYASCIRYIGLICNHGEDEHH